MIEIPACTPVTTTVLEASADLSALRENETMLESY
jgi:hypothetical protein